MADFGHQRVVAATTPKLGQIDCPPHARRLVSTRAPTGLSARRPALKTTLRHYNLRVERRQWDRLATLARDRGVSPAEIVRAAIDAYFAQADLLDASRRRLVRIGEFQQLALDVIIREQFPEFRERILAEVDKRVELHHGAR
ncbi:MULTISPECIES: CopG family transcriptional regulator [unclassified Sphingomonas]|uniref:ribbon-helix-helix domain-containing protein n=1 Tax=unclassified Sphingomonas TaxID=196159 RepID=UPI0025E5B0D3|nr:MULTISPECIES: CopG family transcriptional regulator [unclassified Sphingomonas]